MAHLALDASIDVNRKTLLALLKGGVSIRCFDHHRSGEVPVQTKHQAYGKLELRGKFLLKVNRSPHALYYAQAYAPARALCCDEAP